MYKVFVDHKPVLFVQKEDVMDDFPVVRAKEVVRFRRDVKALMEDVSMDRPLQIACKNVDKSFKRIFEPYHKLEAAGGLVRRKQKFLVIKRKGLWDIPKGGIDPGESREDAAVREIEEECGIMGHLIEQPLVVTYHIMKWKEKSALKRTHWFVLNYTGGKKTKPQKKEGITKADWFTEDELLAIRGNTYGSINEVLDAWCALKEKCNQEN